VIISLRNIYVYGLSFVSGTLPVFGSLQSIITQGPHSNSVQTKQLGETKYIKINCPVEYQSCGKGKKCCINSLNHTDAVSLTAD
jgi:hypothetical protein